MTDAGPGFPADVLHRQEHGNGTGLGLAIIDAVAEAHAGRAETSNRPGGGAQLRLTIRG